jgi:hypothetical protein
VRLNCNYSAWKAVVEKFGDPLSATNIGWQRCSAEEQRLILTHYHERDHLATFLATPFGLLVWRCHQVLAQGVTFFCRHFDEAGVYEMEGPLVQWYQQKGHAELLGAVANGQAAKELTAKFGSREAVKIIHRTMVELCEELDSIQTLLAILIGNEPIKFVNWTLEDFAELANVAYGWLCKRSGLPHVFEWIPSRTVAKSRRRLYLDQERPWNGLNIIEAMARYHELQILECINGVNKEDLDCWFRNSIFGTYKPAFEFVGGVSADPFVARSLLSCSLISGVDPATIAAQTQIAADEVLPWHRLSALRERGMTGRRVSGKGACQESRCISRRESIRKCLVHWSRQSREG